VNPKLVAYLQRYYSWCPRRGVVDYDYVSRGFSHEGGIIDLVLRLHQEGVRGKHVFKYDQHYAGEYSKVYTWILEVDIEEFVQRVMDFAI